MWFTREQFALCDELRVWGLEPRFEPGDVVARGFADLGFEEFQVLPGPTLLSLTAGSMSSLLDDHRQHFFWIPSVDEVVELIESRGCELLTCTREDARSWIVNARLQDGAEVCSRGNTMHMALLKSLYRIVSGKES